MDEYANEILTFMRPVAKQRKGKKLTLLSLARWTVGVDIRVRPDESAALMVNDG